MENKIELRLGGSYSLNELKDAVVTSLSYEYIADRLIQVVREYSYVDLKKIEGRLADIFDQGRNITFAKVAQWTKNKKNCYQKLLDIIPTIDGELARVGAIMIGEVAEVLKKELIDFLMQLTFVKISFEEINFGMIKIKESILNHMIEELTIVDQTEVMVSLNMTIFDEKPLDIEKFRNLIVEKKVAKLGKIVDSVKSSLDKDYAKLHNELMSMFNALLSISKSDMLDANKEEKGRNLVKIVAKHKKLLDKLQDKMSNANELKRQLILNRKRLLESLKDQIDNYDRRIADGLDDPDLMETEKASLEYITDFYTKQIDRLIKDTDNNNEDISNKFDIVDKLMTTLKTAIPSENELKRFSNIAYKFQELAVKLDMTKVQMEVKNKDVTKGINTATAGFRLLVSEIMTGKEVYVKNSLMSAMFNSINIMYDLVDKEDKLKEIPDIKLVTNNLNRYSYLSNDFQKGIIGFRKIARDGLSALAIMMGKEYDGAGLVEIIEKTNDTLKDIQDCLDKLGISNNEQSEILKEVLSVYKNEE